MNSQDRMASHFQEFLPLIWWFLSYNDNKCYFFFFYSIGHVPGSVLSTLHVLTSLIYIAIRGDHYYPLITGEETSVHRCNVTN